MTDQLQFFRDSLIPTKKRTIKVEGGRLYSDQCEKVTMRVTNEKSILTDVLYVPNFGVNLLFEKKLCVNDLKRNFDENGLYLHDSEGRQMLRASNRKRLYIVNKIAPQLKNYVLIASSIFRIIVMSVLINSISDDDMIIDSPEPSNSKAAPRSFDTSSFINTFSSMNHEKISMNSNDSSNRTFKLEMYRL